MMGIWRKVLVLILVLFTGHLHAADSLLRIACEGNSDGAEISINGQFKGQCPLDIKVKAGTLRLRAEKKLDDMRIGVLERDVRMGDDVVQRMTVVLTRKFTESGRQIADERNQLALEAHAREKAEYERALAVSQKGVDQCVAKMTGESSERVVDCWKNSSGCVGPWPCENSGKRMLRCSANEKTEFVTDCKARVKQPAPPAAPRLEVE